MSDEGSDKRLRRFTDKKSSVMRGKPVEQRAFAAKEAQENPEVMRGTISFDFVIDKNGRPYCMEFDGMNTGVGGSGKIQRLMAHIRNRINPDEMRRDEQLQDQFQALLRKPMTEGEERRKDLDEAVRLGRELRSVKLAVHANQNPDWVELICGHKDRQVEYIPEENRPRTIVEGNYGQLLNAGKPVVFKRRHSARGTHVEILNLVGVEKREGAHKVRGFGFQVHPGDRHLVQEFIESRGADLAPQHLKGNAQSLRLTIDFRVLKNGDIVPEDIKGHQRVSIFNPSQIGQKDKDDKEITLEDALVVNMARGAESVDMSEQEYNVVYPVAMRIIQNLLDKNLQREH